MAVQTAEARCWISALTVDCHGNGPYITRIEGKQLKGRCIGICPIGRESEEGGVKLRVINSSYWRETDGVVFGVEQCNGTKESEVAGRSNKTQVDLDLDIRKMLR